MLQNLKEVISANKDIVKMHDVTFVPTEKAFGETDKKAI